MGTQKKMSLSFELSNSFLVSFKSEYSVSVYVNFQALSESPVDFSNY